MTIEGNFSQKCKHFQKDFRNRIGYGAEEIVLRSQCSLFLDNFTSFALLNLNNPEIMDLYDKDGTVFLFLFSFYRK